MKIRLPGLTDRTAIVGKTGSGKTQFSTWLLSTQPFDKQPYIIVDYKRDELLNSVDRIREISFADKKLPTEPGLYILQPMPHQDVAMENFLWRVWEHEKIGLYFDEGTLVPGNSAGARNGAFQAILQQGRSKRVPAITVSQRPAGISKSVLSEADFFAGFYLNTDADLKRIAEMMPKGAMDGIKQDFHCVWYDVKKDTMCRFSPVPNADNIRDSLDFRLSQLRPKRRVW